MTPPLCAIIGDRTWLTLILARGIGNKNYPLAFQSCAYKTHLILQQLVHFHNNYCKDILSIVILSSFYILSMALVFSKPIILD
jgi:hypothetical protein